MDVIIPTNLVRVWFGTAIPTSLNCFILVLDINSQLIPDCEKYCIYIILSYSGDFFMC